MALNLAPNILQPDQFYQTLIQAQSQLDEDQAMRMNAKLILLLANHIGDIEVLEQALKAAQPKHLKPNNID